MTLPTDAQTSPGWIRGALIAAALVETLGSLRDVPVLFGDHEIPGNDAGGLVIQAAIVLSAVSAIAALIFAISGRIRSALVAMAVGILATWISYLPSVALHGLDTGGSVAGMLFTTLQIILAPFVAGLVIALAVRHHRLPLATILAVLPTVLGVLAVVAFAIGVSVYGF